MLVFGPSPSGLDLWSWTLGLELDNFEFFQNKERINGPHRVSLDLVTNLPTVQELLAKVENKVRVKRGQPVGIPIDLSQLG